MKYSKQTNYGKRNRGRLRAVDNTVRADLSKQYLNGDYTLAQPKNDRLSTSYTKAIKSVFMADFLEKSSHDSADVNAENGLISGKIFEKKNAFKGAEYSAKDNVASRKAQHTLDRLDDRTEAIIFDSDTTMHFAKVQAPQVQVKSIRNISAPEEVNEEYILGKHLLLVDAKYSSKLAGLFKTLLPSSYITNFADIHLFKSNDIDVILRGPFVLSKSLSEKLHIDFDSPDSKKIHIWVFDCPKVRDTFSNLQFDDFLKKDPYVLAFGFPPPEGAELEGLEFLSKVARQVNGKILSSDTGSLFNTYKPELSFVWRVNKILAPNFISSVLSEVFGHTNTSFNANPPKVFETNFSDILLKDIESVLEENDSTILRNLRTSRIDLSSYTYLFRRLMWNYFEGSFADSYYKNLSDKLQNAGEGNADKEVSTENALFKGRSKKITKDWVSGYSFVTDFGFSSIVEVATSGNVDIDYRKSDSISSTDSDSALVFEYVFKWLPKDLSMLEQELLPSVVREQKLALVLLQCLAMKLQTKYGGVLLNSDSLPLLSF
ncbi:hypothetical protein HCQ94_00405 [Actinomyces sp. zg-332]|uniref:hypothetical protein n=1 Tax=Actinomyces sp. zg-332 TaxID=2708340 RepID=UPI00141DF6EE|nr:hypothetical protein [Actinomyces sp. zg-332]QPK94216.1 hypothetical protein HCQ94_00405 [Actinomyces sp. zg-332]